MKKILITVLLIVTVTLTTLVMSSCNRQIFDFQYSFDRAYMKIGDEWKDVEIKSWTDYEDGEQLQITLTDGTVVLTNSINCILYKGTLLNK